MLISRREVVAASGGLLSAKSAGDPRPTTTIIGGEALATKFQGTERAVYFLGPWPWTWMHWNIFGTLDAYIDEFGCSISPPMPENCLVRYVQPGWISAFNPVSYPNGCEFSFKSSDQIFLPLAEINAGYALIVIEPRPYLSAAFFDIVGDLVRVAKRHAVEHGFCPIVVQTEIVDGQAKIMVESISNGIIILKTSDDGQGLALWRINAWLGDHLRSNTRRVDAKMSQYYNLFSIESFSKYREFAHKSGLCGPFAPFVGERYGDGRLPKLVYCGVAAWWNERESSSQEDMAALDAACIQTINFVAGGLKSSPFWWLFDDLLDALDNQKKLSRKDRRQCAAWTNLSKLGAKELSAPPDTAELRKLDVDQMRHEINCLTPDILLCVSGNGLIRTGEELFYEWGLTDFKPSLVQTEVRRLPNGGWLYWTMHPQRQGKEWRQALIGDIQRLLAV